jgi:UDP-glucose 4-epimerase
LIKRLIEENYEVVGIDDYSNSSRDTDWESEFEFHQQDIRTLSPGHGLFHNVDTIFHLAAKARVAPSFENPMIYYDTNVTGTLALLEAARQWKVRKFVFSSSSSVYGGMSMYFKQSPDWAGFKESKELSPESPYAISKVHGEELCKFYRDKHFMDCVVLRYFNVYGDNQPVSGQYPQMLPNFMHLYKEGKPFTIYGTGEQRRDFTYVNDVVDANIQAMLSSRVITTMFNSNTYNIGSGKNYSVNEICDLIDPNHPREYLPARKEPPVTLADNENAKNGLAWKPTMTVEQWIKEKKQKA